MTSWDYFISGYQLIFRRGLRRYVIVPLLINVAVFVGLIWFGAHEFHRLTVWIDHFLPGWLQWLGIILWILFGIVAVIILVYIFSLIANLVAAPFNGFLSEKVEELLIGKPVESSMGWSQLIKEAPRMIMRQLHYIGYFLLCSIGVLVLFFIPGVNILVTPVWYILSAWMMTVQYIDYPMDNHRVNFKDMRRLLAQKRGVNLSFGALVMIASMIPIVNFIVIPAAVAGATKLWLHEYGPL